MDYVEEHTRVLPVEIGLFVVPTHNTFTSTTAYSKLIFELQRKNDD